MTDSMFTSVTGMTALNGASNRGRLVLSGVLISTIAKGPSRWRHVSPIPFARATTATARGSRPSRTKPRVSLSNEGGNMLRKLYLVPVLALFLVPAIANAQFEQGNWELTLSGSGVNDQDFDGGSVAVQGSLGYFMTKEIEVGL